MMQTFTANAKKITPGIILCIAIVLIGILISDLLGGWINQLQGLPEASKSPISSIFVAIVIGLLIRNLIGLHETFQAGVTFSIKFILKFGIILLGIRLSFIDVIKLGAWGIPIILICVMTGLIVTLWFTNRLNQSHRLGSLIAAGTGICGVTAIVAITPGIKANDEEVAYAIANITLFGIIAMFAYPYLAFYLFSDDPIRAGLFLGTSIHETAQVAGASLIYFQAFGIDQVIETATITKLTRNVLIIAVVPLLSYYYLKNRNRNSSTSKADAKKWYQLIPLFVIGFLIVAVIRSIGDAGVDYQGLAFGTLQEDTWKNLTSSISTFSSTYLLGIAMAGVGLSTNLAVFKGLGYKPFIIGLVASITVTLVALTMVTLLGGLIQL
ncbi:YeiH family protein [Alkalibacillus aidingensis]|uniref:YeiH family protein n=1 Tax=Alkalibacillus aidingensis TaxID=2747607 RepID=UPI001CB700E7|nr:putative sulfate exporter family transporter [Alkalibacillus aidingensis]